MNNRNSGNAINLQNFTYNMHNLKAEFYVLQVYGVKEVLYIEDSKIQANLMESACGNTKHSY